jgi:hypothetical protein
MNAEESASAVASDITMFAEPGPVDVSVATVLHAEVRIGHVSRALLVTRGDQLQFVAHVVQGIENPDIAMTTDAEHVRHVFLDQRLGDQLTALHHRHCIVPFMYSA